MTSVSFERLVVRDFRNIRELELRPAARLNVIAGDNGQGKTSVLEALYAVATSKSFRTDNLRELVREGAAESRVFAEIRQDRERREQRALVGLAQRGFSIDGKRPKRLAEYAVRTPVVVFHPGDLELVSGPAQGRRTLLDRVALFLEPSSSDDRARYVRALRERQRALEERGVRAGDLPAFEEVAAEYGARLSAARRRAAEELIAALLPAFTHMATPGLRLDASYQPGGSEDAALFVRELAERRVVDLRRGRASFGPQRDELELAVDGRPARQHASQGQQRVLTLALKVAELTSIREARRVEPVLLLDDVSSELDPSRTGAVYAFLRQSQSQIFVTTTRPELFTSGDVVSAERADWCLVSGALQT
jgi:DNA replication and repair protein RecF